MSSVGNGEANQLSHDELVVLRALIDRGPVPWDLLVEATRLGDDRVSEAVDVLVARETIVFIRRPRPDLVAILLTPAGAEQLARTQATGLRRSPSVA